MNPESIRRTNVIETIIRSAFAGVPWREVFTEPMAEFSISPEEIEAKIAEKKAMGLSGFTPAELSMLDDYINEWMDVVNATGPSQFHFMS